VSAVTQRVHEAKKTRDLGLAQTNGLDARVGGWLSGAMRRLVPTFAPWVLCVCCGGSAAAPKSSTPSSKPSDEASKAGGAEKAADATESKAGDSSLPTACAKTDPCVPPAKFVNRLCAGSFPGAALFLFQSSVPFTHAFLTRRTEAWNASGGVSAGGYVEFDEEVVLLRARKADLHGMQVSGAGGGYDALRWDGSCVSLSTEEVTENRPPTPKSAKVEFRFLDSPIQDALRENEAVNEAYRDRRKECKGATTGDVSLKCVKADAKLSDEIVNFVRGGGKVPPPEKLP
jgi:hypothetical protein